jgi:hypothetical protein
MIGCVQVALVGLMVMLGGFSTWTIPDAIVDTVSDEVSATVMLAVRVPDVPPPGENRAVTEHVPPGASFVPVQPLLGSPVGGGTTKSAGSLEVTVSAAVVMPPLLLTVNF